MDKIDELEYKKITGLSYYTEKEKQQIDNDINDLFKQINEKINEASSNEKKIIKSIYENTSLFLRNRKCALIELIIKELEKKPLNSLGKNDLHK